MRTKAAMQQGIMTESNMPWHKGNHLLGGVLSNPTFAEKKVIVVADVDLIENYLIYIDKVENVSIEKNSDDYKKYFEISKFKMANNLYNT